MTNPLPIPEIIAAEGIPPPVLVVLDAADDAAVTAAALAAHDPARGRITVHPTPSTSNPQSLAHDVLVALGKPVSRFGRENVGGAAPAWRAVRAWISGEGIRQVVVLRGHLMSRHRWEHLLALRRRTGVSLVVVCHTRGLTVDAAAALAAVPHQVTGDVVEALAAVVLPEPAAPVADDGAAVDPVRMLPRLPGSELAQFRAEAYRQLTREEFARVDAVYRDGMSRACVWLSAQPDYRSTIRPSSGIHEVFPPYLDRRELEAGVAVLESRYTAEQLQTLTEGLLCLGQRREGTRLGVHPWRDEPGLQVFLSELVAAAPTRRHTVALVRGAQAGFLLHGLLLDVPPDLEHQRGPGLTQPQLTPAVAARLRTRLAHPIVAATLAAAVLTGQPLDVVRDLSVGDLADDASVLHLRARMRDVADAFAVPDHVRGLLRAAREFRLDGTPVESARRLFTHAGLSDALLHDASQACQVPLPGELGYVRSGFPPASWHRLATAWFVGDPLHGPVKPDPTPKWARPTFGWLGPP